MEIKFDNLQDNIIYHANIFNYDKHFLLSILNNNVRFNFSEYYKDQSKNNEKDWKQTFDYLNSKSKVQEELMTYAVYNEYNQLPDDIELNELQKKVIESKAATKALRFLFNLFMFSYEKADENAKKEEGGGKIEPGEFHANNLISCLLYFDGISMINIDVIKLIENNAEYTGKTLKELIFMILYNDSMDFHIKEVASHILCIDLMQKDSVNNAEKNMELIDTCKELMIWTYENSIQKQRDNFLTSNLSLLLVVDDIIDYFLGEYNEKYQVVRKLFELMTEADMNVNIIYEALLCMWNISSNKKYFYFFEQTEYKYIEKIVQVIRTNKIDKVARIGLMIIQNLLESQICVEILFDIKFMQTVSILLTNKWNDPMIKEILNYCLEFLGKNYKSMK
jgi:hypothetical protein